MLTIEEYIDLGPFGQRARVIQQRRAYNVANAQIVDKPAYDAFIEVQVERIVAQQLTLFAFKGGTA